MGMLRRAGPRHIEVDSDSGVSLGVGLSRSDLAAVERGVDIPCRVGDYLAWQVSSLEGAPDCQLYWSAGTAISSE